jgi:uncharacterized membrane protein
VSTAPPSPAVPPGSRSRLVVGLLGAYGVLLVAAIASGNAWLDLLAAFALVSLLLSPGLRRGSVFAWSLWLAGAAALTALAALGHGRLALDLMPVFVNLALCTLFARTLARGREPLIAGVIAALEGRERLALPGVAAYARGLTAAWVLLFGAQAALLAWLVACAVPEGALAAFGLPAPLPLHGEAWRWYLHLGSYALVLVFLLGEYAFRRWRLRHIPHASLPRFIGRLVRRWPRLVRSFADDAARATR